MLNKIKKIFFGSNYELNASIGELQSAIVAYLKSRNINIKFLDDECRKERNRYIFTKRQADIIVVNNACTLKHVKKILDLFNNGYLEGIIAIIYNEDIHFARPIIEEEIEFLHQLFPDLSCFEVFDMLLNKDGIEGLPKELIPSRETYKVIKNNLCPELH